MGWTFLDRKTAPNRTALVSYLTRPAYWGEGYAMVDYSTVGNHLWGLVERKSDGRRFVSLHLMESGGRADNWSGWGYKDMDETCGPTAVDCPLRILNGATVDPMGYAAEWRERVRAHHANRSKLRRYRATVEPGRVLVYCGRRYTLVQPLAARRGWQVTDTGGAIFRMTAAQVGAALRAELDYSAREVAA